MEEENLLRKPEPHSQELGREGQNISHPRAPVSSAQKRVNPPSDITGAVTDEILRRANVSRKEADKRLVRVERVDETIDDGLNQGGKLHFKHAQDSGKGPATSQNMPIVESCN